MLKRIICILCIFILPAAALADTNLIDQWDTISRIPGADGLYLACRDELWGVVNRAGEILLEPRFRYAPEFENGYAVVAVADAFADNNSSDPNEYGSYYGVIDDSGKLIVPPEYDSIDIAGAADIILVEQNGQFGFMDMSGRFIIESEYDRAQPFVGEYAAVAKNYDLADQNRDSMGYDTCWGMIDRSGKVVIPLDYDWLEVGDNGLALVQLNGEYGYVNAENEPVIDLQYWSADVFVNGYAAVAIKENPPGTSGDDMKDIVSSWGVIDETGREIIPCQYESLKISENGIILVRDTAGSYRYLTLDGEALSDEIYYRAETFVGDYAAVGRRGELPEGAGSAAYTVLWGAIDSEGNEILPMEYNKLEIHEDGTLVALLNTRREAYRVENGKAVRIEE